jgi:hypothetical protein
MHMNKKDLPKNHWRAKQTYAERSYPNERKLMYLFCIVFLRVIQNCIVIDYTLHYI